MLCNVLKVYCKWLPIGIAALSLKVRYANYLVIIKCLIIIHTIEHITKVCCVMVESGIYIDLIQLFSAVVDFFILSFCVHELFDHLRYFIMFYSFQRNIFLLAYNSVVISGSGNAVLKRHCLLSSSTSFFL